MKKKKKQTSAEVFYFVLNMSRFDGMKLSAIGYPGYESVARFMVTDGQPKHYIAVFDNKEDLMKYYPDITEGQIITVSPK